MSAEVMPPPSSPIRESITVASPSHPTHPTAHAGPSTSPRSPITRKRSDRALTSAEPVSPRTSVRLQAKVERRMSEVHQSPVASVPVPVEEEGPKYLQPSEFSPLNNHSSARPPPPPPSGGQWLSPEDDKMASRGIPIFRPTYEEFIDFEGYVTKTVPWGQYSGIVKIIPPAEWSQSLPSIPPRALSEVKIKSPIQQNMLGQAGLFRQTNVEKHKNRPLTIKQWFEKSTEKRFSGPGPKDVDLTVDRDSTAAKEARERLEAEKRKKRDILRAKRVLAAERKAERLRKGQEAEKEEEEEINGDVTMLEEDAPLAEASNSQVDVQEDAVPPLDPSSSHSPHSTPEPLARTPESDSDPVDKWYEHFDAGKAWLPKDTSPDDYTPEACLQMERKFWKTMGLGEPSWYGADLQGTLFPDPQTPWNVAHLPNLLNRLGRALPGVNKPYLYFGMWRAAFAWHVEDMDLFSINYIHFGAPKFWYAIPQGQAEHFERTITGYFPREAAVCDQFLRHKSYVMSPTRLAKDGINVNMLIHNQGEFVITYPRGYHSGFNLGFNCAESVNFALDSWLELGRRAKVCECVSHSVRIDVDELLDQKEKLEAQQENLKTEHDLINAIEGERSGKPRKRISLAANGDHPKKRRRTESIFLGEGEDAKPHMPVNGLEKKKRNAVALNDTAQSIIVNPSASQPCILCPHPSESGLLPVYQPAEHIKQMCKAKDGIPRAHEACVTSIPEVWTGEEDVDGERKLVVMGVDGIEKGRWHLKCQSCKDKKKAVSGAKVQCVNGKCPRAFHVTCARNDPQVVYRVWEVDEWKPLPLPADAPEGTQHEFEKVKTLKTELLCPSHNPEVKEAKKAQQAKELRDRVLAILPEQMVKIKTTRGSFEVKMVRVIEESQRAEVEHDNVSSIVKWTEFDFRPGPAQLLENEYARVHTHTRRNDSGSVALVQSSSASLQPTAPIQQRPLANGRRQGNSTNQHALLQTTPIVPSQTDPRRHVQHSYPHNSHHILSHPHQQHPPHPAQYAQVPYTRPPPIHHQDHRHIPSRVVLCDSQQGYPSHQQHTGAYAAQHGITPSHQAVPNGYHQPPPLSYNYYPTPPPSTYLPYPPQPAYPPGGAWAYGPPHNVINGPGAPQIRAYSTSGPSVPNGTAHEAPQKSSKQQRSPVKPVDQNGNHRVAQPAASGPPNSGVGKIDLGLKRMATLMRYLAPLRTPAVHLAGTNGKGSVSAILESCFRRAGMRVARYNSPHLIEPRDAIALDGQPPSASEYDQAMRKAQRISTDLKLDATTFEIATAAAYDLITEYNPDVMIIECGMGGEGDATNVIPPHLVIATALTAVGLDHTAFLGDTIENITAVKAGIAVKDGLLCIAPQDYEQVIPTAKRVAALKGSKVVLATRPDEVQTGKQLVDLLDFHAPPSIPIRVDTSSGALETRLSLPGKHQLDNASLAVNLLTAIRSDTRAQHCQPKLATMSHEIISEGVAKAAWPGRCSWLQYPHSSDRKLPVLVDGAHNSDSAKRLRQYIDSLNITPKRPITWVLALSDSKGKTPESVLEPLLRPGDKVYATAFGEVEGMPWVKPVPTEIVAGIAKGLTGAPALTRRNVGEVMDAVEEDEGLVVVAGSLYLVAEFYKLVRA